MIIITAVGADRPGMAHAVAQTLADLGCNIEDTTMTRLSGEFAMILIVTPPSDVSRDELQQKLAPLETSHGLFVNCRDIGPEEAQAETENVRCILSVYGPESKGLVARITGVLAEHGVNITDVQTRVASAGALYVMVLEIELPEEVSLQTLQGALDSVAQEIGVEVSLRALDEETL